MQKILIVSTKDGGLRSDVVGWTAEDGDLVQPGPIGVTFSYRNCPRYETPLHAIGDGWKLLAPPTSYELIVDEEIRTEWEWWFTKE